MSIFIKRLERYDVVVHYSAEIVRIGCHRYTFSQMCDFFEWYFCRPQEYRTLVWDEDFEVSNIYRKDFNEIRIYIDGNFDLSADTVIDLFLHLSEYLDV